jgi:hypothetical protein
MELQQGEVQQGEVQQRGLPVPFLLPLQRFLPPYPLHFVG